MTVAAITAAKSRLNSQPHKAAYADVTADRSQQRATKQQIASEAREESRVVRERDEGDVRAKLLHSRRIRDHQQGERDRGRDHTRRHSLDPNWSAHQPFGCAHQAQYLQYLRP